MKASEVVTMKVNVMEPDGRLRAMDLKSNQCYTSRLAEYNGIVVIDDILRVSNVVGDFEDGDLTLANQFGTAFRLIWSQGEKVVESPILQLQVLSVPNSSKESLNSGLVLRVLKP